MLHVLREPLGKGFGGLFPLARPERLRKDWKWYALVGLLVGMAAFLYTYGWQVLDVTNEAWLLNAGGDLTQHYLGWKVFRQSAWGFPLGMTDGLTYPFFVSITYTDSIPLFAIFFKLLSPILPSTFQYFGLWGLLTYMVTGALSSLLVRSFTTNYVACGACSLLLTLTPSLLQRMFIHTALAGHFLFIAGLLFWVYGAKLQSFGINLAFWCGLLFLCGWIHPYFFPMVGAFLLGYLVHNAVTTHSFLRQAMVLAAALLAGVCSLWLVGAFHGGLGAEYGGLSVFSFNLNGFYNPVYAAMSRFIRPRPLASGQTEGLAYLGLGGLLLLALGFAVLLVHFGLQCRKTGFKQAIKSLPWPMLWILVAFIQLVVVAASPVVSFNTSVLFEIPYPAAILRLLGIFRASGRLAMPAGYILLFAGMWLVHRYAAKFGNVVLVLLVLVQFVDTGVVISQRRHSFIGDTAAEPIVAAPVWDILENEGIRHVVYDADNNGTAVLYSVANAAVDHGMTVSNFYLARPHPQAGQTFRDGVAALVDGSMGQDTVVLTFNEGTTQLLAWLGHEDLYLYDFALYSVALTNPLPQEWAEYQVVPGDTLDVLQAFSLPHTGMYDEESGIYILEPGAVLFGPYTYLPEGRYTITFEGENLNTATLFVGAYGEVEGTTLESGENTTIMLLDLAEPQWDIEFTVSPGDETVEIGAITLERLA